MPTMTFKATTRKLPTGLAVEGEARGFKVIMDEPPTLGGSDTGMTPVELMLVALGGCQVIVASAFASAQGVDLQDIWVELEGDLDPMGFTQGAPGVRMGFQEIRLTLHMKSDSPPEKLEALAEFIASRCPVEDNLVNHTRIVAQPIVIEPATPEPTVAESV